MANVIRKEPNNLRVSPQGEDFAFQAKVGPFNSGHPLNAGVFSW
jgi:hypothetical protein